MPYSKNKGCACGGNSVKRNVKPRIPGSSTKIHETTKRTRQAERSFGMIPGSGDRFK